MRNSWQGEPEETECIYDTVATIIVLVVITLSIGLLALFYSILGGDA